MTRQSRARWLAFATALLVVLLAALFAWLRNLAPASQPASAPALTRSSTAGEVETGRQFFARAGCTGCHSADGQGHPGLPLDGVGGRLDRENLRAAAFGQGSAANRLPPTVTALKRAHANEPDAEALLTYLQQLK